MAEPQVDMSAEPTGPVSEEKKAENSAKDHHHSHDEGECGTNPTLKKCCDHDHKETITDGQQNGGSPAGVPGTSASSSLANAVEAMSGDLGGLLNKLDLRTALDLISLSASGANKTAAHTTEEAKMKKFQFWDTQPVPKFGKLLD